MFPAAYAVADSFDRPDGTLGPDWLVALGGTNPLVIVGGRATASVNLDSNASAWKIPCATATAVAITAPVLPDPGDEMRLFMIPNIAGATAISLSVIPNTPSFSLSSGGSTPVIQAFAAGDSFAVTFDPVALTCAGWYRVGAGPWAQVVTRAASSAPRGTAGWLAGMLCVDTTVRLKNFAVETLPGGQSMGTAIHGRGAC